MPTSGGSIAEQDTCVQSQPTRRSSAQLRRRVRSLLGDTNITELGGAFDPNMPQCYFSVVAGSAGASDNQQNVGGSSAGSAVSVAAGLAMGSRCRSL